MNRLSILIFFMLLGCGTIPTPKMTPHHFPKTGAYAEDHPTDSEHPYDKLGVVRTKVNFSSLHPDRDDDELCRNYYNKAVNDLIKRAKTELKGDGVINVRSVVFYMDGSSNLYTSPECSDDGTEGQILVQGRVIRYKKPKKQ